MTVTISGTPDTRLDFAPDTVAGCLADFPNQLGRLAALFAECPVEDDMLNAAQYWWNYLNPLEDQITGYFPSGD